LNERVPFIVRRQQVVELIVKRELKNSRNLEALMVVIPARLHQVWSFIKLSRVVFLLGGFLLYALGAALVVQSGRMINWAAYILGQLVITSIQLMGQYLNEHYDMEVDSLVEINRTWFSGGSGILAEGSISPAAVLAAARSCAVVALISGTIASLLSAWMIPIVIISFLASWFYSSPPLSLMSSGWGELSTSIIVALVVPLAGYCMQGGFPPGELWLICIPLILVHAAMLISFQVPDHDADLSVGKKTLTVRLGQKGAAWLVTGLIASAFLLQYVLSLLSDFLGQWMLFVLPLALWQMVMVHRVAVSPTRVRYYLLTAGGVALFVLMAFMALLGMLLAD
jgi:1,4-dihydroxy-2-naphthoate octaprenyltransferase